MPPGGDKSYVIDGRMTKAFAMIASEARTVQFFNPDLTWVRIDIVDR